MRNAIRVFSALVLLLISGCYSTGNKMDRSQIERFQKGVTTRAEVETHLGPPANVIIMQDGSREARYMYYEGKSDPTNWIPVVNMVAGGSKNRMQNLVIIYNQNNILKDYDFTDASGRTNMGQFTGSSTTWDKK